MRHGQGDGKLKWGVRLCLLLAVCLAVMAAVRACRGRAAAYDCAATIPNDLFAQPVQAAGDEEAEEVMMLKIVCLTFDDGPSKYTSEILEILREYDVPATFFVTAQDMNLEYMPLIQQIDQQGHQVALHSASHDYSKIYASSTAFWLDIKALREQLSPYLDVDAIHWLRFPGGSTNTVSQKYGGKGIMKQLIEQAEEKGYEWIDWNVCAQDATSSHPDAAQILRNIQKDAQNRDICVVLLHDTKATGQTVKALPEIIQWFQSEGYHFCTVEEMYETRDGS